MLFWLRVAAVLSVGLPLFQQTEAAVYISDYAMNRMIELMPKHPFCQLHTDRYVNLRFFAG